MGADLGQLQHTLGYRFKDTGLLVRALTHRSLAVEIKPGEGDAYDNEQLEFLGDAILGFIASDELARQRPLAREGELSRLKSHLVSAAHLFDVAAEIGLGQQLRLGRGEEMSGGRQKRALLSDAMEAVIAAIYLDGGMEACRDVVERLVLRRLDRGGDLPPLPPPDAKSRLQEYAQSRKLPMPKYVLVAERGPEHAKTFTVEARIGKTALQQAEGTSKKAASQRAAELALEAMEQSEAEPQGGPSVDAGTVDA
ncbi:MAG TPA: ribonuclease III [Bryobacteraceae bacterium]|nr:ribonuclease III [Bryobacteraceae bacterium]